MKKLSSSHLLILFSLFAMLITGCSMSIFSSGWDHHKKAEEALRTGDYAEALYQASEAIKLDYDLVEPKVFLKDNHNTAMTGVTKQLKSAKSSTIEGAELRAHIYDRLAKFNSNLMAVKLPFKSEEGAEKPWMWDTTLRNYDKEANKSRKNAYKVLIKHANQLVKKLELEKSEKLFDRAVSKYQIKNSSEQRQARESANKTLSNAYFKRGKQKEKKGRLNYFQAAIQDYETAKKWGYDGTKVDHQIAQVKGKVAESFYKEGIKAGKRNRMKAVESFKQALVWVPGYKDAAKRMRDLLISDELNQLPKNLATTESEVNKLGNSPKSLADNLGKASDAMGKLTYISDNVRKINGQMQSIQGTMQSMKSLPVVGGVITGASVVVSNAQRPIGSAARKFDRAEGRTITPIKDAIEKLHGNATAVHEKIKNVSETVGDSKQMVEEINACLLKQQNPDLLIKVGDKVKGVNKALVQTNKVLRTTNSTISKVSPVISTVAKLAPVMNKAAGMVKKVGQPVGKIGKVTHEINKVLNKEIKVVVGPKFARKTFKFSINKIIRGAVPKIARKAMNKLAKKALNPVLNKLKIKIPGIPGLNKIQHEVDSLKSKYTQISSKVKEIKKNATDIDKYKNLVSSQLKDARDAACSNI